MPSKLFTIMGVARPMIAGVDAHSETAQVIAESGCGLRVEPEDARALAAAVQALYDDRPRCAEMGQRGRLHVEAHYTRVSVARQYEAIFEKLMPGSGASPSVGRPGTAPL